MKYSKGNPVVKIVGPASANYVTHDAPVLSVLYKHRYGECGLAGLDWSKVKGGVYGVHLYLTSKSVESSSSSCSWFRGAISTRSAGVVMMSYFLVFRIRRPDLITLMTRHTTRAAVSTHTANTPFFSVGR